MDYELVFDHHYDRIARDLDVYEIEDYIKELEESKILQQQDVRNILNRDEGNDGNITRAKKLLEIFKTQLKNKIPAFIDHLKDAYPHLHDDFKADLKRIRDIDELPTTKKHIRRRVALEEIKRNLKLSTTFVVIYGMPGTGKTNVAVEAAMHFALEKSVYWVNAGGATGDQLKILRTLLSRVKPKQENHDSQSDPEKLVSLLKEELKEKDAVVILDNVAKDVDLSIFNSLPPSFIITTTDTAITGYLDSCETIDMTKGFSKDESLELISKVVQKEVHSLPSYVANIHKYFQGYPLAVTLIASQLKLCPESNWFDYCQFSDDIESSLGDRRSSTEGIRVSIDSTMQKCIQSLSQDNQYYYKMLAIFKDNVFLTTETLQVLWDCVKDIHKVRSILDELEGRSMVIKNYKVSLKIEVYEIHSTVHNYLRRQQSEGEIKKTHQRFVKTYMTLYENIADIEDDHYIFYYVIYHIISAGLLEEFRSKLFSLDYIMAKLAACGPNDMAEDLKLYKNELEEAGFDKQRLEETAEFSERFGWDIYHTKVKDIQFFLQMPENSLLFKEAMERCKQNNLLVLKSKWLTPRMIPKEYPFQSVVKKLFCLEHNEILCEKWAYNKPTIVLFKLGSVKEIFLVSGSILCICVVNGNMLYKDNGRVFLKQVGGGRTPDSSRQMNGDERFFSQASYGTPIEKIDNIMIAAFSQSGDKVVFASDAKKGVYCMTSGTLHLIPKTSEAPIPTPELCCFCWVHNSEVMMFATLDRHIYFYETSSRELLEEYKHPTTILDMTPIPDKKELLVLSETTATILSWKYGPQTIYTTSSRLTIGELSARETYDIPNKCLKCFATSRWIAIATTDGCEVKENAKGKQFFRVGYGEVSAMDITNNTLTIVTSRSGACTNSCVGRISVNNLEELERRRPYPTDACQRWPIQRGYLLGIVEPGNVVFYNDTSTTFETKIPKYEPISIAMSLSGDIAVVGDAEGGLHHITPFKKRTLERMKLRKPADVLKMDCSGKYIVAGSTRCTDTPYMFCIIESRKVIVEYDTPSPIFDCFFEEHSKAHRDADPKSRLMSALKDGPRSMNESREVIVDHDISSPMFDSFFEEEPSKAHRDTDPQVRIVSVFKNGLHSVYVPPRSHHEGATKFSYSEEDKIEIYGGSTLSCAAYHNGMLIKGVGTNLHVFNLKPAFHRSKDFHHRITACTIEPHDSSESISGSTKPWVAVALATEDRRFQILICCKDLNELRLIDLDYAQEEVQQLVFSKSQTILMARCDWLCFWDVSDSPSSSRSTLHPAWKSHPQPLNTKDRLLARFKLQLEVLSLLPSEDFATFAMVHKKGDRRFLNIVDYGDSSNMNRNASHSSLTLNLSPRNGLL